MLDKNTTMSDDLSRRLGQSDIVCETHSGTP